MDKQKIFGYFTFFFFIAYIFVIGYYGDNIANYAVSQPLLIQLVIYYATQIQFVIILIGATYIGTLKGQAFRGFSAGLLIDLATDMASTPHCVLSTGFVQNAPNLALCSDTIIIHWFDLIFPHVISYALYYYVIPIILFAIAFERLGVIRFLRYIFGFRK